MTQLLPKTVKALVPWSRRRLYIDKWLHRVKGANNAQQLFRVDKASDRMLKWAFYQDTKEVNSWVYIRLVDANWIARMARAARLREGRHDA